jgi:GNAT superfamily N-acetyltransferase
MQIALAETPETIARCYPVMQQLRPHLDADGFVARVEQQRLGGYQLAYLEDEGEIKSLAGFRILETLSWGRTLYVDDLITAETARSKGYGATLFRWLIDHARVNDCDQLHLDSGVQRFGAHRFYLNQGMAIVAHHFAMELE